MPAGQRLSAGRIPGERIGTTTRTTNSATFTAETLVDSITVPLVAGRTYLIRWTAAWGSSVANDSVFTRLRQDNVAGAILSIIRTEVSGTGGAGTRWPATIEAEYTATVTGDKTIVGSGARATGTGNISAQGDPTWPILLTVDYVRG